jgi:hypothetical protein
MFFSGAGVLAQRPDTTLLLPDHLVLTSLKKPNMHLRIDSTGMTSIVCTVQSDSLIREQQRQLSGKMIAFTDSSLVLQVDQENAITYYRNGKMETYYYWKSEDSLGVYNETIYFSKIHTITYDNGKNKQVRGILQSSAYLFMIGNIVVLATAFLTPKKYGSLVSGQHLLVSTGVSIGAGITSFFFYPKTMLLHNQPRKHLRVKWKIEVI